ncbi:glycosyltransferase [Rossellomorea sp. DA94]|uniref:glycosyltransferase n=1 Tax=Rossellomorea sp. DA94 TaxID=3038653 RepID=UPI002446805C|nr:glycosyltransferase [Rossellomorea sp. DA94]WGG45869.1 glycosyltransferase [Rossellomorea sp. DA94]
MNPAISIIVPIYNVEPYLRDCVDSILDQTFTNIEIILVNDGSTDNSGLICDSYSNGHSNIRVIHKEHKGVSSSRNSGVAAAKGDYIGFVDGDDRIEPNMYMELYNLCVETKSDISICKLGREINGEIINIDNQTFQMNLNHIDAMKELFKGHLYRFSLCNKLFNKTCFKDIQFPEGRIHEDLSTTYKLFANSNKAMYTNYLGYIYVKRNNSILTSDFSKKRLEAFIGWDEILCFMNEKYLQLSNEYLAAFTYGCIDNMYYILNQVEKKEEKKELLKQLSYYAKKYLTQIVKADVISVKYKCLVLLFVLNKNSLIVFNNMKSKLS